MIKTKLTFNIQFRVLSKFNIYPHKIIKVKMTKSKYFIPKINLSYKMNFPFLPPMIMSLNLNTEHIIYSSREEVNLTIFSRIHSKPINIRWIRIGSHPYEKIMSFSTNIKIYNLEIKTSFFGLCFRDLGANKTDFDLVIIHFISAESCL